jgi:hypothetical protein
VPRWSIRMMRKRPIALLIQPLASVGRGASKPGPPAGRGVPYHGLMVWLRACHGQAEVQQVPPVFRHHQQP